MLHFGLIGCGEIGHARADALRTTPGAQLVAVTDLAPERAQTLAARYGCAAVPGIKELLGHAGLEVVIVSTPPHVHADACLAVLAAGKHVIVEKPLAPSVAAGREMVEAARARGLTLATGFNYRYYPAMRKARELIDHGFIGALDHVRSFAGHPGGSEFTHPWVHDVRVMGGGTLMDNGIHIIDLTRYFLGEVADVTGFRTHRVWKFKGCEDNAFALLRGVDGAIATLHTSWTEWKGYRFHVEIYGTEGCLRAAYPPMQVYAVRRRARGKAEKRFFLFPAFQVKERLRSPRYTLVDSLTREMIDFQRRLRGETVPAATGIDGLRAIQIAEAVYRSSESGSAPQKIEPL